MPGQINQSKSQKTPNEGGSGNATKSDKLNLKIIQLLQKDGRMPYSTIAEELGLSEGAIRKRVARLQADNSIKIVAVTDPLALSYDAYTMLAIQVAPGSHPEIVANRLSLVAGVVYAIWVNGAYDILIEVVFEKKSDFIDFLSAHIYGHTDIQKCDVMQNLKVIKNNYFLKPDI